MLFGGNVIFFLAAIHRIFDKEKIVTSDANTAFAILLLVYIIGKTPDYLRRVNKRLSTISCLASNILLAAISVFAVFTMYKNVMALQNHSYSFNINNTEYWSFNKEKAENLVTFIKKMKRIIGDDYQVFPYPFIGAPFTLLNLHNPTRYDTFSSFGKAASAPAYMMNNIIKDLILTKTKYIITFHWSHRILIFWSQMNGVVYEPNTFEQFIWDNFKDVLHVGMYTLWKLNTLEPGDTIVISVKGHPELNETVTVADDGSITGPDNVTMKVGGLPLYAVKGLYARTMGRYGIPPDDIRVSPYTEHLFNTSHNFMTALPSPPVLGDCTFWVWNQSTCYQTANAQSITTKTITITLLHTPWKDKKLVIPDRTRLMDALIKAAGTLPSSAFKRVIIIRGNTVIKADLLRYESDHNPRDNPRLMNNDIVYLNDRHKTISVSVFGDVSHAGSFTLDVGARLADAFSMTGRHLQTADYSKIVILRHDHLIKANLLRYVRTKNQVYNPILHDNDIIYFPVVRHKTISVIIIGAVRHTGDFTLSEHARLADTFTLTGGPLPIANLSRIAILRHGRLIKTNFLYYIQTRNAAYNSLLKDNDIVFIPNSKEHPGITEIREAAKACIPKEKE